MFRLIKELKPDWVIGENVAGFISMALDDVLFDLESEGYETQSFVIPACAVGGIHRRDRVWIVANAMCRRKRAPETINKTTRDKKRNNQTFGEKRSSITSKARRNDDNVANSESRGSIKSPSSKSIKRQRNEPREKNINNTVANANGVRSQGEQVSGSDEAIRQKPDDQQFKRCDGSQSYRPIKSPTEPPVCDRNHGLSFELVGFGIKRGKYVKDNYQVSEPEKSEFGWKVLRAVWENRDIAAASPRLYISRLRDTLHEMPCGTTYEGRNLVYWIEKNKGLRDLWEEFYSKPFKEAQKLQQKVFERIREIERNEKMAQNYVNKLKALGNAVVPQIPELIGRAIMEVEHETK